jgi:hypothetical protein
LLQYYSPHLGKSIYCIYQWIRSEGISATRRRFPP